VFRRRGRVGLLPDQPVLARRPWPAGAAAIQELTDFERIEEGKIECKFRETTTATSGAWPALSFSGTVRGANEDVTPNTQLDGYL